MNNKLIPLLFLAVTFMILISCSSEPLPDKGVTILSPKANDVFNGGDFYQIQWKAEPMESEFGAMVTVEFSKDGGKSWEKSRRKCTQYWEVFMEGSQSGLDPV